MANAAVVLEPVSGSDGGSRRQPADVIEDVTRLLMTVNGPRPKPVGPIRWFAGDCVRHGVDESLWLAEVAGTRAGLDWGQLLLTTDESTLAPPVVRS